MERFFGLLDLIYRNFTDNLSISWFSAEYANPRFAITVIIITFIIVILGHFLKRKRFKIAYEGYMEVKPMSDGIVRKLFRALPKLFLLIALIFVALSLAEPYNAHYELKENELTDFLERHEVVDVSGSMIMRVGSSSYYPDYYPHYDVYEPGTSSGENITRGELARRHHMDFARMREGQGDSACLWIFSNNPYILQDCINDDIAYLFQAWLAPHVLSAPSSYRSSDRDGIIRWNVRGEGGTRINPLLKSLIRYIDEEGDPNRSRTVIIFTDAEVFGDYEEEIRMLIQDMNVSMYIILINNRINHSARQFINTVERHGGVTFDVSAGEHLEEALQEIDRLERVDVEMYEETFRDDLTSEALQVSLTFFLMAIFSYFITNPFVGTLE